MRAMRVSCVCVVSSPRHQLQGQAGWQGGEGGGLPRPAPRPHSDRPSIRKYRRRLSIVTRVGVGAVLIGSECIYHFGFWISPPLRLSVRPIADGRTRAGAGTEQEQEHARACDA